MKRASQTPLLTYALNESEIMVNINSVERGLYCNCRCPKCNEYLIAKLGNGGHLPHFAHQGNINCKGSYMSALHKLAEQIIEEEKVVMAPAYKEIVKQKLLFEQVEVEKRIERNKLQPDIVGITSNGLRWYIEIRNTHEVDNVKRAKLIESNITCLEIDVRKQTLENLKSFILDSTENREWINNPNYESQIAEIKCKKVSQIEKLLFDKKEFVIPGYAKFETKKEHFNQISVLFRSEDGLFVRIKANSTEGMPYIFNIGSQILLDAIIPTLKKEQNCNELSINADSVYSDTTIQSCFLDTKWLFHFLYEKEQEMKLERYRANQKYEVVHISKCKSHCIYKAYAGNCIYFMDTISDYVICDKEARLKEQRFLSLYRHDNSSIMQIPQCRHTTVRKKEIIYTKTAEEIIMLDGLYEKLTNMESFNNLQGEKIELLRCVKAKKFYGLMVLYKKNNTYYIYGITLIEKQWRYYEIGDYVSETYALKMLNGVASLWEFSEHSDEETMSPFGLICS